MPLLFIKKSTINNKCKYRLIYFLLVCLIQISVVNAADRIRRIDLSTLGDFDTRFAEVKKIESLKKQSLLGKVSYIAGDNFSVKLPFDAQQIQYQVSNGSKVNKGDTVALVKGFDVHHFIDQYRSTKVLLEIQELHYNTNKKYFEKKVITRSQWIEIAKSYYQAKLAFEHVQHQMSFIHVDENEQISFISPKSGVIKLPTSVGSKMAGELAFDVIDTNALKVKVNTPIQLASTLSHFEVSPLCHLSINSIEKIADKYHQILWAVPSSKNCHLLIGQTVNVTPIQLLSGYKVAKSAVFEFKDRNYIAIKNNETLLLVPIILVGSNDAEFIFTSKTDIDSKQVLISSISILQGNLLSLGRE